MDTISMSHETRPWVLLAGDAPPAQRFNHPVRWDVEIVDGGHVSVMARSALKARRTAQRRSPWMEFAGATLAEPPRVRGGEVLAKLKPDVEYQAHVDGVRWVIVPLASGAVSIGDADGRSAVLPAYVARELGTVREGIAAALAATDEPGVIACAAFMLEHGVVLSAPVSRIGVSHATAGQHPDGRLDADGREAFACVTDPGGIIVPSMQNLGNTPEGRRFEPDRSSFAAAQAFVRLVDAAGAVWAMNQAKARAGA